jgi:hypothetical protein
MLLLNHTFSVLWSCRFRSVAYLQQIWWFEVVGEVDFCFPRGTYSLYFRLHLGKPSSRFGRRICSSEQIHGWDKKPARFQFWTSDGQHSSSQCYLDEPGSWIRYHVGDFVASSSEQAMRLKFSLAQIDCTHTKGGLCVDSVLIYPKGFETEKIIRPQKWCNLTWSRHWQHMRVLESRDRDMSSLPVFNLG